jgi:hypothetical protein
MISFVEEIFFDGTTSLQRAGSNDEPHATADTA